MDFEQHLLTKTDGSIKLVSKYINAKTPVTLSCAHGHTWTVLPTNLVSKGSGTVCRECAGKAKAGKKSTAQFIVEMAVVHPNIKVIGEYTGANNLIEITCTNGHTRKATPTNLLSRPGYYECAECTPKVPRNKLDIDSANNKLEEVFPYLEILDYTSSSVPIIVRNNECGHTGEYWLTNLIHHKSYACKICNPNKVSSQERMVVDYIKSIYSGWIELNDRYILGGKELDIVLPDLGLAIEVNGCYYHSEEKRPDKKYHLNKTEQVEAFGYRLIHIYDYDINNYFDKVKSRLASILGFSTKIYARKCKILEIRYPKAFLQENHFQGAGSPTSVNLGLFLKDELVAAMTFSKPRYTNKYQYELIRFCSLQGVTVVGGASKLLKYFERKYSPTSIISYAKRDWSDGSLYYKLGFTFSHYSDPGYFYVKNNHRINRNAVKKHMLKDLFPEIYADHKTESQILEEAQYLRVNDTGNLTFVKEYT